MQQPAVSPSMLYHAVSRSLYIHESTFAGASYCNVGLAFTGRCAEGVQLQARAIQWILVVHASSCARRTAVIHYYDNLKWCKYVCLEAPSIMTEKIEFGAISS